MFSLPLKRLGPQVYAHFLSPNTGGRCAQQLGHGALGSNSRKSRSPDAPGDMLHNEVGSKITTIEIQGFIPLAAAVRVHKAATSPGGQLCATENYARWLVSGEHIEMIAIQSKH